MSTTGRTQTNPHEIVCAFCQRYRATAYLDGKPICTACLVKLGAEGDET